MKLLKRTLVLVLAFILFFSSLSGVTTVLAAELTTPKVTVLQNDFIKITVDNNTGRFGIRTVEGQPIRKNDQNVNMLFRGDDPETSFTTFRIDGTDYIFGNPYKFAVDFFSEVTKPQIVVNNNGTKQIETIWSIKGVEIKQILMLYASAADKKNAGNVNIRYEVVNRSGAVVQMGTRLLLDTMVAGKDGPEFQIGTAYKAPLMVERKLVHNPENDPTISEEDRALYKLPPYWVMRDKLDLTNPLATNVIAYGFNNFAEKNINIVDEMIVGHWNGLANTKWDYTPNPNLDFTRDTNDYGTADSAVAFYWQPKALADKAAQSFETVYGLGEIIEPDKIFSIRYMDTPQQLATLSDNSNYVGEGIFDIIAEVENLAMFGMEHSNITVNMELESGLNFVKLDEVGNIVRDANGKPVTETFRSKELEFKKTATPEEAAQGIKPKYKPGDSITASYKVQAKGKAWPTTKQYMLTARSPETRAKIEGVEDEGIKAQYESNKANFMLLPAIGQAAATYAYGLSPKELYSSDVKYLTVNLTNIEAYNAGNDVAPPNFDLFLKEKVTGKRYKVPVKQSVILQAADDGFSGDMRITYRGGDLVDRVGNVIQAGLGPELPLGDYQVQIDFKGDAGGDEELAALFDITTGQTFSVTDNQQSRVREANILAVYKKTVDLSHVSLPLSDRQLAEINEAFPGKPFKKGDDLFSAVTNFKKAKMFVGAANKALDPKFDLAEYTGNESLAEVPAYNYQMFGSDEEMAEFFEDEGKESLVTIRGMIKEVGTGNDKQVIVDTKTEPAIINDSVAYKGKDMVFVRGKLDVFGIKNNVNGYDSMPFFDTLFVKGDGRLSVANSGFVFHQGEWTLDFFNGFDKSLGEELVIDNATFPDSGDNEEDDSLNGALSWASGALGDRLNPFKQLMISQIYFNKHTLFTGPSFYISGFSFSFNDFILRHGGISFGGKLSMKVIDAEVRNVIFNDKGFVGVEADLKFDLNKELGLFEPSDKKPKKSEEAKEPKKPSGEINIVHYVQDMSEHDIANRYGIKFDAQLKSMLEIKAELAFKKVADGRILPDVVAFGTTLGKPGVLITGATYLTAVRGAVRELADTIAGGSKNDPFPLVVQAGVSVRFGIAPAYHFGDIDLTVKRTGLALLGKLDFSTVPEPEGDQLLPMLTKALLEAQWVTPWFVRLEAEVDIGGFDIIIGKAGIFVGQNLEKHRTDFEGYIGARVQIPSSVPVVGGMPLSSVFFGVNNEKIWGSVGILFISLGLTYYWGGGVEFGTSGEGLPEGFIHLLVQDPERGPRLLVIGQGVETLATSRIDTESEKHEIVYRKITEDISHLDTDSMNAGIGGITVKNSGRVHEIPMNSVSGNAIIEMEYVDEKMPNFTLKDAEGKVYPIVFDNTNTNPAANAFTQFIAASNSKDKVDVRKAYIILPQDKLKNGGTWTLTAESGVDTRLLNVPVAPGLKDIKLNKNGADPNKFTAAWSVENAKQGDTINLYLTKDAESNQTTKVTSEKGTVLEVLQPGEPGLLIAKDLPVNKNGGITGSTTNGSEVIDVTQVGLLGDKEDIRGLLQQGEYYLRAELKSSVAFGTKTSAEKFEIIDPLAPAEVSEVAIEPAGNGYFSLSFKPAPTKAGHQDYEQSYRIEALQESSGKLNKYPSFAEMLLTKDELAKYLNKATGKYEGIPVGGWTALSTSDKIDDTKLNGAVLDLKDVHYTGLEVGQKYVVGVSAANKPTKAVDKNENYHFAGRINSTNELLPIPVKPVLKAQTTSSQLKASEHFIELVTNQTTQSFNFVSDQQDLEVEAFYSEKSIGKTTAVNNSQGSQGTISFDQFKTDGTYAIELIAKNKKTKDVSATMLYLTLDTSPPVLYLDEPVNGARAKNGQVTVSGTTSKDTILTVNGTQLVVQTNGKFSGKVNVTPGVPNEELVIIAKDAAGNENKASVVITNDGFKVPVALVLKTLPTLKPGGSQEIAAFVRVPDGKDASGKPKFREVEVTGEDKKRLSYAVAMGEAVNVGENGTVSGVAVGASLIEGTYTISEGVSLQSMVVASVAMPAADGLETISAYTSSIEGNNIATKVIVNSAGDMAGQQLVYKVYPKSMTVTETVKYKQNLSSWSILPDNGQILASSGDSIVVAKRTIGENLATAASGKLSANVWSSASSGGGGGGGGGGGVFVGSSSSPMTINNLSINADRKDDKVEAYIKARDVESAKEIKIASQDKTVQGFTFHFDKGAVEQAISKQQTISIEVPMGKLMLTPNMLAGMDQELVIKINSNGEAAIRGLAGIAADVNGSLLASGQGASIEMNIPEAGWSSYVKTRVAVPEGMQAGDITAVILQGPDGNWTTVPWKLANEGGAAYVDVSLTGNGNLAFIRNNRTFKDVSDSHWGKGSISEAASRLFALGKDADRFEPDSRISRAEYPTLLLRVAGLMNKNANNSFKDVANDDWYNRSVSIAAQLGIVNGLQDGSFAPQATLSRVEAMTMAGRTLNALGLGQDLKDEEVNSILSAYKDRDLIPDWAKKPVALSIKNGIIQGEDDRVNPQDALTRAQAAAIAVRLDRWISGK
ncbi:S-layer homology domain-containing protein [Paenibacillus radicis (ex Xue et al. 2023)]|uniref:S-layer homology domain-containing protein n=1 Tax=Paenibacillus radicis (ex Xue et al. 2023) TaxID=2972489 RepID=A0ABT1YTK8_9BACL|nr:S-layer homology domain-containing protein [Paenibacillus radicis (ex Xue et al. 2023)]MCR8636518.1 S-layer homology domain-containing protein [Paenibacillus radicis (ex Xue et al. 2023)]